MEKKCLTSADFHIQWQWKRKIIWRNFWTLLHSLSKWAQLKRRSIIMFIHNLNVWKHLLNGTLLLKYCKIYPCCPTEWKKETRHQRTAIIPSNTNLSFILKTNSSIACLAFSRVHNLNSYKMLTVNTRKIHKGKIFLSNVVFKETLIYLKVNSKYCYKIKWTLTLFESMILR